MLRTREVKRRIGRINAALPGLRIEVTQPHDSSIAQSVRDKLTEDMAQSARDGFKEHARFVGRMVTDRRKSWWPLMHMSRSERREFRQGAFKELGHIATFFDAQPTVTIDLGARSVTMLWDTDGDLGVQVSANRSAIDATVTVPSGREASRPIVDEKTIGTVVVAAYLASSYARATSGGGYLNVPGFSSETSLGFARHSSFSGLPTTPPLPAFQINTVSAVPTRP